MRTIRFLLVKEFLQIFRNRAMLPILFVMPLVQLLVLSFAATYELKEARIALVDRDRSSLSREIISRFEASGHFLVVQETFSTEEALERMERGEVQMVLQIPRELGRDLTSGRNVPVQLVIDAVDGTMAGLIHSYSASILESFNRERVDAAGLPALLDGAQDGKPIGSEASLQPVIRFHAVNWYNPELDYITYMVPGILAVLVCMIGLFLSGMNIVREKELGTMEQLNVTPVRRLEFIAGKLTPFWIIGMVELLLGLGLARFGFGIPFLGSTALIMVVAGIFLVVVLSIGLMISTVASTQQRAMFIAWFIMVVFILMGGLFTPLESMPGWAQLISMANPVAWFIRILRMVMLKGAGLAEIRGMVFLLLAMAVLFVTLAVGRYRKTTH